MRGFLNLTDYTYKRYSLVFYSSVATGSLFSFLTFTT